MITVDGAMATAIKEVSLATCPSSKQLGKVLHLNNSQIQRYVKIYNFILSEHALHISLKLPVPRGPFQAFQGSVCALACYFQKM